MLSVEFSFLPLIQKVVLSCVCVSLAPVSWHWSRGLGGGPLENRSQCPGVEGVPLLTEQPHFHGCHQRRCLRVEGPLPHPAGGQGSHRPRLHHVHDPSGWAHRDRRERAAVSWSSSENSWSFVIVLGEMDRSISNLEKMQIFTLLFLLHHGDESAISPRGPWVRTFRSKAQRGGVL